MFKSEIHEHSFGTSLYIRRWYASQRVRQLLNRHGPEPDAVLNCVVNPKIELFNGLRCEMDSSSSFANFNPLSADRVLANHKALSTVLLGTLYCKTVKHSNFLEL